MKKALVLLAVVECLVIVILSVALYNVLSENAVLTAHVCPEIENEQAEHTNDESLNDDHQLDVEYNEKKSVAVSNSALTALNDEYAGLWQKQVEKYYQALFDYYSSTEGLYADKDGITYYPGVKDHASMMEETKASQENWLKYYESSINYYKDFLYSVYGTGSIVPVKLSDYSRILYRAKAIEMCELYSSISSTSGETAMISVGDNYEIDQVYTEDRFYFRCRVYNNNKELVFEESELRTYPQIDRVYDDIIDIHINRGTGLVEHRYYSLSLDKLSDAYVYVSAFDGARIAYVDVADKSNPTGSRVLTVKDVFDGNGYYKSFELDFHNIDTPVVNAEFINDKSQLKVSYYSAPDGDLRETVLDL